MEFMESLTPASFTRINRVCTKKACHACPWQHSCMLGSEENTENQYQEEKTPAESIAEVSAGQPEKKLFPAPEILRSQSCRPPTPCQLPDCEENICDILRSIARIETSLAHVLNAEGEKMQKAIELACSVNDLLALNQSVQATLSRAAALEHSLYLKLEAVKKL